MLQFYVTNSVVIAENNMLPFRKGPYYLYKLELSQFFQSKCFRMHRNRICSAFAN